ncbi:hypothetical protein Fot_14107 [Forsythia ovata]|uniref:Uncharacterized protein n=1 Tax=Forsythia ovata TaxID=205694 RepID=A0ABD1W5D4_9LAMI
MAWTTKTKVIIPLMVEPAKSRIVPLPRLELPLNKLAMVGQYLSLADTESQVKSKAEGKKNVDKSFTPGTVDVLQRKLHRQILPDGNIAAITKKVDNALNVKKVTSDVLESANAKRKTLLEKFEAHQNEIAKMKASDEK